MPGRLDKSPQSPPRVGLGNTFFFLCYPLFSPKGGQGGLRGDQGLSRIRGGLGLFAAISHACMYSYTSYTPEFHTLEYEKRGFALMTPLLPGGTARDKLCRRVFEYEEWFFWRVLICPQCGWLIGWLWLAG